MPCTSVWAPAPALTLALKQARRWWRRQRHQRPRRRSGRRVGVFRRIRPSRRQTTVVSVPFPVVPVPSPCRARLGGHGRQSGPTRQDVRSRTGRVTPQLQPMTGSDRRPTTHGRRPTTDSRCDDRPWKALSQIVWRTLSLSLPLSLPLSHRHRRHICYACYGHRHYFICCRWHVISPGWRVISAGCLAAGGLVVIKGLCVMRCAQTLSDFPRRTNVGSSP